MLRARREEVELDRDLPTAGLAEQVERRAELRELLQDIGDLPDEQRAALLLAEVGDLSHADIGEVLDCEAARVKALVFRARSSLIERREARATPCEEIREQLSVLSGGSLRRSGLTHHLRSCSGCRTYREEVKRQRQMLAAALPVIPPAWLSRACWVRPAAGVPRPRAEEEARRWQPRERARAESAPPPRSDLRSWPRSSRSRSWRAREAWPPRPRSSSLSRAAAPGLRRAAGTRRELTLPAGRYR